MTSTDTDSSSAPAPDRPEMSNNTNSHSCSSSSIVIVSQLSCVNPPARTKLIQAFRSVVDWTLQNEPETLRYAICDTQDEQDLTSIYIIEELVCSFAPLFRQNTRKPKTFPSQLSLHFFGQNSRQSLEQIAAEIGILPLIFSRYASPTAYTAHTSSPAYQTLLPLLATTPTGLLTRPAHPTNLTWHPTSSFEKPALPSLSNPHIIYATIHTPSPTATTTLAPYGASVVHNAHTSEPACLFYANARCPANPCLLAALEVYTDPRAFEFHVSVDVVGRMIAECRRLGGELCVRQLRLELGFLTRAQQG